MLHELLLVLSGYPGDVFTPSPAEHANTFAIASDFPLLHDAERAALNRLAHLGWLYSQVDNFVRSIRNTATSSTIDTNTPHGSYFQALAVALNSVMKQYRQAIIDCEKRILQKQDHLNGAVPIIYVASAFAKWFTILPALTKLITEIEEHPAQWHGCRLLNLIVAKSYTGVVELRDILNDILHQLHIVMYKQITSWMIYGHLSDSCHEFFITPRPPLPSPSTSNASLSPPMPSTAAGYDHSNTYSTGQFDHCLEQYLIPSHIPLDLAESILFVGEIVKTVRDNSSAQTNSLPKDMMDHHLRLLLQLSSAAEREKYATSAINVLQLQSIVDTIRRSTAEWMFHQVLVGEHDILRYLESFKDFYLLGQGDFARNLIEECDQLSWQKEGGDSSVERRQPMRYGRRQMDALLQKAQIGCLCEDWPELSKYSIRTIRQQEDSVYSFSSFLLNGTPVLLSYHYRWPLNLFLTSDDMNHYAFLWEFLISLKKVQSKLNALWVVLRGGWSRTTSKKDAFDTHKDGPYSQESMKQRERLVWRVRSKMLFWIDALWYHVQVLSLAHTH
jgi:gamma-tubulin complex component 4